MLDGEAMKAMYATEEGVDVYLYESHHGKHSGFEIHRKTHLCAVDSIFTSYESSG